MSKSIGKSNCHCCDCYYSDYETTAQGSFCVCKHDRMIFGSAEASVIWSPNHDTCSKFLSYAEGEQLGFSSKSKRN